METLRLVPFFGYSTQVLKRYLGSIDLSAKGGTIFVFIYPSSVT